MVRGKVKINGQTIIQPDHIKEVRLLDLAQAFDDRTGDERYYFRFGQGDDFNAKLQAVKAAWLPDERMYEADRGYLWSVRATPENRAKLCAIFPNAKTAFEVMESQLSLF